MASAQFSRGGRISARTLFLSDLHLGFRHARVRELNEFLGRVEAGCIVLVGDIVDALSLARRAFWSPEHTRVVRTLLARQRAGTRLIYIPGNHDASLAMLAQMLQGQLEVHREWVHRTARGARLLVLHGDQFDGVVSCPPWLTRLGDTLLSGSIGLSHLINNARRTLGQPYWPLTERLKLGIDLGPPLHPAVLGEVAAGYARTHGYDGVVCGVIPPRQPCVRDRRHAFLCQYRDWAESCSALTELGAGWLTPLRWSQLTGARRPPGRRWRRGVKIAPRATPGRRRLRSHAQGVASAHGPSVGRRPVRSFWQDLLRSRRRCVPRWPSAAVRL
jgi:UDP-2,3-diacylglucosamine pyrophosphatase LpxH